MHNFMDGMVIAAGFAGSVSLGIFTTILVIVHEIPQELGDFGVLVYGVSANERRSFQLSLRPDRLWRSPRGIFSFSPYRRFFLYPARAYRRRFYLYCQRRPDSGNTQRD